MEVVIVVILVVCVAYAIDKKNAERKSNKQELERHKAEMFIATKHITGLPLGEQSECRVFLHKDKITIESLKTKAIYNLNMDKILDVNIKTDEEIQNNYTSSIGGAVGGAVLFGPLGAMIGGRSKKKVDKIVHNYLIFTYNNEKENKTDYISFDVTGNLKAHKFVDYFTKNNERKTEIDL